MSIGVSRLLSKNSLLISNLSEPIMNTNPESITNHPQPLVDLVSEPPPLTASLAIEVQGLALRIIATVALIYALNWAQSFLISLLLEILLAYTLNPLVEWLGKIRVPRLIATTLVMAIVISGILFGAYSLSGQIQSIIIQLPEAASKLSAELLRNQKGSSSNMQKMQNAASTLEKATSAVSGTLPVQHTKHIIIDTSPFKVGNFLWSGSKSTFAFIGEMIMIIFLAYFLLLSGDSFKRKLVRLTGPSLTKRKITVNILDEINASIQNYMLMLIVTNVLVGLLTWAALS
jgi:predicted PurR-regulated permease PerM